MYSIFIFNQFAKNKYIRYSYLVKFSITNIFVLVFGQKFYIRVTLKERVSKNGILYLSSDPLAPSQRWKRKEIEYQLSGKGGTRSPPATPHRLRNQKWPPGRPQMADGVWKGIQP